MKILFFNFLLISIFAPAYSQWIGNSMVNTAICTQSGGQDNIDIVSDSKGGAILAWTDNRSSTTQSEIFIQRINSVGVIQWTVNGVSICSQDSNQAAVVITEDGAGGAFVAWNDFRNGDRDVYAQSIDSLGQIRWALAFPFVPLIVFYELFRFFEELTVAALAIGVGETKNCQASFIVP